MVLSEPEDGYYTAVVHPDAMRTLTEGQLATWEGIRFVDAGPEPVVAREEVNVPTNMWSDNVDAIEQGEWIRSAVEIINRQERREFEPTDTPVCTPVPEPKYEQITFSKYLKGGSKDGRFTAREF